MDSLLSALSLLRQRNPQTAMMTHLLETIVALPLAATTVLKINKF